MIRSILYLRAQAGDGRAVEQLYRRGRILEVAVAQEGCLAAELQLPVTGAGPVVVTALWDTPDAYQRWLDNPARTEYSDELNELLEPGDAQPIQGDLYEVVIATKSVETQT